MSAIEGRRVLLVEDESMVAMLAEDMLIDLGCDVTVAMRLDKALPLARHGDFDLAVLDVNLGRQRSYPVADLLFERGVPFLFATGYGQAGLDPPYQAVPVIQKPYRPEQLRDLLTHLVTCASPARKGDPGHRGPVCACGNRTASPRVFQVDGMA